MQLDYVDLLFCHRPDPFTPIEETCRAMNFIIEKGWAFYWGTSEWSAEQLTEACEVCARLGLISPLMDQTQYNMLTRKRIEQEYLPLFKKYGLGITSWSPLASGVLSGKYSGQNIPEGSRLSQPQYKFLKKVYLGGNNSSNLEMVDVLVKLAQELGCSASQLAICWCLKNENISTVILGATSIEQAMENFQSLQHLEKLTPDVMQRIENVLKNKPSKISPNNAQSVAVRSAL
eukprot:Lithocolla_globosa_v1_NODE_8238_length_845_cov_8.755696.p1 type:complete len:232 gc:universal NODE_8238_length_845_cov_8.755696:64-759(+)